MPRKDQGWITFQTSAEERQLLEDICQASQRTKTEVLREMLRGLRDSTSAPPESVEPAPVGQNKPQQRSRGGIRSAAQERSQAQTHPEAHPPKPLKVSSRNILAGRVKRVIKGSVSTEVTIEIILGVELTSTITTTSAEALELAVGKAAYAVIKSSDVVIAME
jgi:molybdopterin-binding protein